jgi:hypothetical protein
MEEKFTEYKCEFCNSEFVSRQSRCNHIRKFHKTDDKPNDKHDKHKNVYQMNNNEHKTYNCVKCNKKFSYYQSRWRHEKICTNKIELMEQQILVLKKEVDTLKKKEIPTSNIIEKKASKMQQNNINGEKNNVSIVNGNVINNFNNDNLSFITPEFFKGLLKEMLFEEDFPNVIPKVIEEVKFNKEHPENHNFKLNNTKSKKGEIFNNDGWKKVHEKDCIDFLTKRGYQIYKKLSETHQNQINGRYIEPNDNFNEQFLTGKIIDKTNENVKKTAIKGTDNIKLQTREELEEELSKELVI